MQPIRLAVVAPASNADPEKVLRGVERLRALGHTLKLMPHVLTQAWPYFAATASSVWMICTLPLPIRRSMR